MATGLDQQFIIKIFSMATVSTRCGPRRTFFSGIDNNKKTKTKKSRKRDMLHISDIETEAKRIKMFDFRAEESEKQFHAVASEAE